jgi:hypothetical protein
VRQPAPCQKHITARARTSFGNITKPTTAAFCFVLLLLLLLLLLQSAAAG